MYFYVSCFIVAWLCVKLVRIILDYIQTCRHVSPIPKLYPQHWFWGCMYKVSRPEDLFRLVIDYVHRASPRWFSAWNMFLYPFVFPADPGTMREVLTAIDVPKNIGIEGGYRMMKGWLGDGLLISNGKKWERSRRLLTPAFHFDILKGYIQEFNSVADNFITKLSDLSLNGESVDVFPPVSRATLDSMLRCAFSYQDDSVQNTQPHHPFVVAVNRLGYHITLRWMNPLWYPDWIYNLTSARQEFKAHCDFVHTFSTEIINKRRQELENDSTAPHKRYLDFLDILLTAKDSDGNGLSDIEIRDEVDTFVFEGHDTTASAISWTLNALATYPAMQLKIRQEVEAILNGRTDLDAEDITKLQYTTCFIKETLRLFSPVPWTERKLKDPLKMNGVTLRPGQSLQLCYAAVHHNPRVWQDPEVFQPDRFLPENMKDKHPYAFIPFSAGQRNCIGQHFAMNEIKVIISKVVTRFELSLDGNKPAETDLQVVLRAKDGIFLYLKERQCA